MKLPSWLEVVCRADASPALGMFVSFTLQTGRKGDFTFALGPTDADGRLRVPWTEVERWVDVMRDFFVMDYTGPADFTGVILISPMSRMALAKALDGYELWRGSFQYPPGYADQLREAIGILDGLSPAQLTVEVEHDGEGITVRTETVPA